MKKTFLFLLMLLPMVASAYDVCIDGIYYNLVEKARIAEVTYGANLGGYAYFDHYRDDYQGQISIPSSFIYEGKEYTVTTIGQLAFEYCSSITSINLPTTITTIKSAAFRHCSDLESINIPEGVSQLPDHAFTYCYNLQSINIPSSLTTIGGYAFDYSGVTRYNIVSIESWLNIKFIDSPLPPERHLYINDEEVTNITIPTTINTIKDMAFARCIGLKSIQFHDGVTSIGQAAFYGCSGITNIQLSESITSIGNMAFSACTSLESVKIPNGIISIGYAFQNCTSLKEIIIPNGLNIINNTFNGCSNLISISLPNSVQIIDNYSFNNCSELRTIILGNEIYSIGEQAFANCTKLSDVYCFSNSVPQTNQNTFDNSYIDYATLHVPASSISSYSSSSPWSSFQNIVAISSEDITIGDLGIGTFCGSNPIDLSATEDVRAYVVSSYESATGQVMLTRTYYIPPFTGVVVKGNKGVYTIPAGVGQPVYPNMMKGVTTNTVLNKLNGDYTNYVLANKGGNLGFYAVTDGSTLSAGKAYLPLPTAYLPTTARELTLTFEDGETTDIIKVVPQEKVTQNYYDLQGRRVANPTSGLYIVNGKKVIIK